MAVKKAGQNTTQASRGTTHGSRAQSRLAKLAGRAQGRDRKPTGFLSRRTTPATGRRRGGPWG